MYTKADRICRAMSLTIYYENLEELFFMKLMTDPPPQYSVTT